MEIVAGLLRHPSPISIDGSEACEYFPYVFKVDPMAHHRGPDESADSLRPRGLTRSRRRLATTLANSPSGASPMRYRCVMASDDSSTTLPGPVAKLEFSGQRPTTSIYDAPFRSELPDGESLEVGLKFAQHLFRRYIGPSAFQNGPLRFQINHDDTILRRERSVWMLRRYACDKVSDPRNNIHRPRTWIQDRLIASFRPIQHVVFKITWHSCPFDAFGDWFVPRPKYFRWPP